MGVHSSIGIALKPEVFEALPEASRDFLLGTFETHEQTDEGHLFHVTYVKWYQFDPSVASLYEFLHEQNEDDFLVLEACHDYPSEDAEGDLGAWTDNPWGMVRNIEVSISFG